MRIGVGLPTTTPGADARLLLDWARTADAGPFASLGTVDRLAYPGLEAMACLAAAAAVTRRVRLATMVLIGPLRDTAALAAEAAALQTLSAGRLVLGVGMGARDDDFEAAGRSPRNRGPALSRQLYELREAHAGTLLVGGGGGPAFLRAARHADGYSHGGGPPRAFAAAAAQARAAWVELDRPGAPTLWGQGYFCLGDPAAVDRGRDHLRDYYRFTGGFEERVAAACLTTPTRIKDFARGYEDAGCDELILFPALAALDQLERLADVVG